MLLGLTAILSGCTMPYMINRGRDAADVFTTTVGVGAGAKARIGPIHAGLFAGIDAAGLRGGELETWSINGCEGMGLMSIEGTVLSFEAFQYVDQGDRGKDYIAEGFPLISVVEKDKSHRAFVHPYYTQIEVAGGVLGTARLGVNPGELVDFILGWAMIDIFADDIENREKIEQKSPVDGLPTAP